MSKPKGSGYFSAGFGFLFLIAFISSFFFDLTSLSPYLIFQIWLIFAAMILLIWGLIRVKTGENKWKIGQPTLNFIVGIVGVTIALLAIVKQ